MFFSLLFSLLIGYLIGSIPTTYIIVKKISGKVITNEGTGNVGAMNSYEITQSKAIGIASFAFDFLKGILAIFAVYLILGQISYYIALGLIGAVAGHNWSIFLKFKGGRGLSTAAGGSIVINPIIILFWAICYFISKKILSNNVHIANIFASVVAPILLAYAPITFLQKTNTLFAVEPITYKVACALVCLLILVKHIKPIRQYIANRKA